MDSFELNKIIGAVLGTLLFVMGAGFLAEAIYHPIEDRGPGYALPEPEPLVAEADVPAEAQVPLGTLLAAATVEQGATAAKKCQSCHSFDPSGENKTGPGLYDVVGRVIGGHPGFAYSEALAARQAAGETWTYEELDAFLLAPKEHSPGTKMNFAGVKNGEERANILAYLGSLSASPVPFPAAEEAAAPAEDPVGMPNEDQVVETTEPGQPAEPVDTPVTTQSETPVTGTPTTSGQEGIVEGQQPAEGAPTMEPAEPQPAQPDAQQPAAPAPSGAEPPPGAGNPDTTVAPITQPTAE